MSELLLELFSEEIPVMMQQKAARAYKDIFSKYFTKNKMSFDKINVYVGPRRLTIHAVGMSLKLMASTKVLKGPKISAPRQAIEGFCRSNNIVFNDLNVKNIEGRAFYIYKREIKKEQNTKNVLFNTLHEPIAEYVWPKSMYWGDYKIKWVRPLQNILCIFDEDVMAFEYGHLVANNKCYGHRFMSPSEIVVNNFSEYKAKLADNFIILDSDERKKYIKQELLTNAIQLNLVVKEDKALLEEVVGLAEYPQVMVGKIDQKFLTVPNEILVCAMRGHQKYFSLFYKNGDLAPYFLFVSNIKPDNSSIIISGNEKMLSARLADALYFYEQDLKTTLESKVTKLEKVIFHAKLGNLKEKTIRVAKIVKFIDSHNKDAELASLLCKSDIVSEVVNEFPNLQGIMGYYYAKAESINDETAKAIRDHYKPQGSSDEVPTGVASILALADKSDSLCGLMLAGEKASGSKDPFALRRQALGMVRIILENNLNINLNDLVTFVLNEYKSKIKVEFGYKKSILSFLEERIRYFFREQYDIFLIAAVLDLEQESNLNEVQIKLQVLKAFLSDNDGKDLLITYKRASNILANTELTGEINEATFITHHESTLFNYIKDYATKIDVALFSKNYSESLKLLASMRDPISNFFDNVMVKNKDSAIANNRMLLLARVKQIFNKIAKFDKL